MEVWKKIEEYPMYEISDKGRVKTMYKSNKNKTGFLKNRKNDKGYYVVDLTKDGKKYSERVHRLIAKAFIENPEGKYFVDHINRIRDDNRIENLRWVTKSENEGNSEVRKSNLSTGVKGVSIKGNKYRARIAIDGKEKLLGHYNTVAEAKEAYNKAFNEKYGDDFKLV